MPAHRTRSARATALAACVLLATSWSDPGAQVRPVYSRGAVGLIQQLERLQTTASALHTGAHPDDEDSALLATLARGEQARTAYLSLNRGEGGQNILGGEFYEALGVLRTEELQQARVLDGAEQLFTRVIDFGFTTSMDEALKKWGKRVVLGDMVRAIRLFRPLVVISRFSGTAADGHGHHQLAGHLTPRAFEAAADPTAFPEHLAEGLRPWQAGKLYVEEGVAPAAGVEPTMRVETGTYDAVLGRSYFEVAMEGRSQHKSQEMGRAEARGPHSSALRLLSAVGPALQPRPEHSVFDGIDTSIRGLASLAGLPPGALAGELNVVEAAARRALDDVDVRRPARILPTLAEGLHAIRTARTTLARVAATAASRAEADFLLEHEEREFEQAMLLASGVVIDALADRETVAAGEAVDVVINAFVPRDVEVHLGAMRLAVPPGWKVAPAPASPEHQAPPVVRRLGDVPTVSARHRVNVPAAAPPTQPYWLHRPADRWVYTWDADHPRSLPFALPPIIAAVPMEVGGVTLTVRQEAQYREVDSVRGEVRRRIDIVPAITLSIEPSLEILRLDRRAAPRRFVVGVMGHATRALAGRLRLMAPDGWRVTPAEAPFTLDSRGARAAVSLTVEPPVNVAPALHTLRAEAAVDGTTHDRRMQTIAYPHVSTHRLYWPAEAKIRLIDLRVAPVRVGYIMGTGDEVPSALTRMGLDVTLLGPDELATGDLGRFDTIVVGVRAYEARPDLVTHHQRLLDWVRAGGALIVQQQMPDYVRKGLAPFPAEIGSRVTDEEAPVTVLAPDHPVFNVPNNIAADDWKGWVQERNAYGFTTFDARYTPLLEAHDPWDSPQRGGELYARIGKGHYVYTAYSWFRQLPPGVPGAYRLMANLVSLGGK